MRMNYNKARRTFNQWRGHVIAIAVATFILCMVYPTSRFGRLLVASVIARTGLTSVTVLVNRARRASRRL